MNTSDVLNRAADLIEERGWVQGPNGWLATGSPVCILGGIYGALGVRQIEGCYCSWEAVDSAPVVAVARYLDVQVGKDGAGIYRWNDAPGRTATEVIAVLRATALIEAAKENTVTAAPAEVTA